jgi:hypothetical protein
MEFCSYRNCGKGEWDGGCSVNGAVKPKNKTVAENFIQIWVAIHSGRFEELSKPSYE